MNPESRELPFEPPPLPVRRSLLVTLAGMLMLSIGALGSPISLYAILNWIVGGYGSRTFELSGFVIVVLGPWILMGTGLGLMLRWRLAYYAFLALQLVVILGCVMELIKPPRPEQTFIAPSGVKTTILASEAGSWPMPMIVIAGCLGALFLSRRVREEFR